MPNNDTELDERTEAGLMGRRLFLRAVALC